MHNELFDKLVTQETESSDLILTDEKILSNSEMVKYCKINDVSREECLDFFMNGYWKMFHIRQMFSLLLHISEWGGSIIDLQDFPKDITDDEVIDKSVLMSENIYFSKLIVEHPNRCEKILNDEVQIQSSISSEYLYNSSHLFLTSDPLVRDWIHVFDNGLFNHNDISMEVQNSSDTTIVRKTYSLGHKSYKFKGHKKITGFIENQNNLTESLNWVKKTGQNSRHRSFYQGKLQFRK